MGYTSPSVPVFTVVFYACVTCPQLWRWPAPTPHSAAALARAGQVSCRGLGWPGPVRASWSRFPTHSSDCHQPLGAAAASGVPLTRLGFWPDRLLAGGLVLAGCPRARDRPWLPGPTLPQCPGEPTQLLFPGEWPAHTAS